MSSVSRRAFFAAAAAAGASLAGRTTTAADSGVANLAPLTGGVQPIAPAERGERLRRLQALMQQRKVAALLVEPGSTLEYFTGDPLAPIRAHHRRADTRGRPHGGGDTVLRGAFGARDAADPGRRAHLAGGRKSLRADRGGAARAAPAVRSAGSRGHDALLHHRAHRRASPGVGSTIPADELVGPCRMHKSAAELALMQAANNVTLAALRHVHGRITAGMSAADIQAMMIAATGQLGGVHEFSLVLLNEASAYPHGSLAPQLVRSGSVILIDTGCSVHGYQSDISRSWVFGEASARQRQLWDTVKRGQQLALDTARVGAPVGAIDRAVRDFYEQQGWSKNYRLPGLSHRTGHGIGMDVHEPPYLVRSDTTPLQAGMCFSDEPGLYIPGEFGIRLEDCWYMTAGGPKLFTALATSIDQPV